MGWPPRSVDGAGPPDLEDTMLSLHRLRLIQRLAVLGAVLVMPVAVVGQLPGANPHPRPVRTTRSELALAPTAVRTLEAVGATPSTTRSQTPPTPASAVRSGARSGGLSPVATVRDQVAVAGVTWARGELGADDVVQIRVRKDGRWGSWQPMDHEGDHGPDTVGPGAVEKTSSRAGTEPFVVIGEQVQTRVFSARATLPRDLRLTMVDPGTSPADGTVGATPAGSASAAAARPTIYTRAQWGADESMRKAAPQYAQVQMAFIHHTDGSNSYTASQVPAIIRGIYDYHVNGNGWSDIGYNFLVDRFGRIWEGRYGGVDKAVIGAQTLNYNSWSTGVAAMGNFDVAAVPSAVSTAISSLLAWKFTVHGIPALGTVYARDKYFNRISGHRDGFQTACPGRYLYAALPAIRSSVAARMGTLSRTTVNRDVDRAGQAELLSYATPASGTPIAGPVLVRRSAPRDPLRPPTLLGSNWNTVRNATLTPDLTGDGHPDLVAQDPAGDTLRVYRGNGAGGVSGMATVGTRGWNNKVAIVAAGDQNRDGRNDLLGVGTDGVLAFYPGAGNGTFGRGVLVGSGWAAYRSITGAGDLNGDGIPDLLAVRKSDGALVMAAGRGNGAIATPVVLSGGWGGLSTVLGAGDLDGDGHLDIIGRDSTGALRAYYGDDANHPARWNRWGSGWGGLAQLTSGVDFTGDGRPDLLGVVPTQNNGTMRVYAAAGVGRDFTSTTTMPGTAGADLVRLVGDINGDGWVDAVMRVGDTLQVLPGTAGGGFGPARVVSGAGWATMVKIEPGADQDSDGVPDLLVTNRAGLILRYGFRRDFTLKPVEELEQGWSTIRSMTGVGAFNGDANGDVVVLAQDGTLALWRGSGPAPLLDSVVLRTGQTDLTQIVGVGDYNGDGAADIVAESSDGRLWLYAGRGDGGLWPGRQPMAGAPGGGLSIG
ncbi:FG-GAP-like repeat-containing protein [Nostocoides sp. HKS02]|uniref:FG-GAP-like repeat-containing protein n=1 Tax=Nostocoides sp. HKS02 TaxID=1813880 RepID=UPI0012B45C00|nr:FG-GAP-like repeat-containing protein [Tetrasphaera sp. HKS02]QGN56666.1 hypothetical protein GKE56_00735 [Tetrasphaera sp. HKS02]